MPTARSKNFVLIVDDDPTAVFYGQTLLTRADYTVATAGSAKEAREHLAAAGAAGFDAVVTDYRMPDEDGLSLLRHVRQLDPALAVIIVTAEGEKDLVKRSLQGGAHNFLEKPVNLRAMTDAVADAVASTRRRRKLRADADAARSLGHSQYALLGKETAALRNRLRIRFHSYETAGGDFAAAFSTGPGKFILFVSDVSGHDLRAAYHSAYLQGVARGLCEAGAGLDQVFAHLNRLLLSDWNQSDQVELSLAACAVAVDLDAGEITALNCGLPAACLADADGWPLAISRGTASPLGWFEELKTSETASFDGGSINLWSDGLIDVAEREGVSPLALAFRLHRADETSLRSILSSATDDVLAVSLNLDATPPPRPGDRPLPLLDEIVRCSEVSRIDEFQDYYERSLRFALPEISEENLLEALLCIRESLLNALHHGCEDRPDSHARLQAVCHPGERTLSVRVADDGPGHTFDVAHHERRAADDLLESHRGLVLMRNLAASLQFSPTANCVTMRFSI